MIQSKGPGLEEYIKWNKMRERVFKITSLLEKLGVIRTPIESWDIHEFLRRYEAIQQSKKWKFEAITLGQRHKP